ncbi:MAG: DEAD/DEAH box helicase [Rothia sp. (in: high G+C Gram-positive bacteria)]|uniref:DEAD/DEAH box helicase n=1 Tax=Rothia sp. (in: high G+C Gram-positive bacteria) TaxID=1885016 RepID=UPI0026E0B08C|nr:DEAD/DEAH box helicase [Rothia sp. (in: high G+C Gram-positive bacteria)]MDO5750664.1 DEAD/DEAH box helicase [Rothia sp. (in: high G+C Gram-positive bacteria)]
MNEKNTTQDSTNDEQYLSPAERYAAAKAAAAHAKTRLASFEKNPGFALDDFQRQACTSVENQRSVLVAAPTGAGKTVVGEFGIYLALATGKKAFYTTPIKALSNQKYHDFVRAYGEESVGLLTGDTSINTEAPVVVMTTEVLRNMLYAASPTLENLGYVVMDEVHYLADRFRGAVWEEAIIHLPEHVTVISLSATVSNVEEFGAWLDTVRGGTDVILSETRPVPLWQHMMVGSRIVDLFVPLEGIREDTESDNSVALSKKQARKAGEASVRTGRDAKRAARGKDPKKRGPKGVSATFSRGESYADKIINAPEGLRFNPLLKQLKPGFRRYNGGERYSSKREKFSRGRGGGGYAARHGIQHDSRAETVQDILRPHRISRPEMVRSLDKAALLPAICFIFSRAACDDAVAQCVDADIVLTTDAQAQTIRAYIAEATAHLDTRDLNALGYYEWREGLERGIAAHHAGLLPLFKEVVEALFAQGLVKIVFATETLALGINMPARTVILEKLTKFNGEGHVDITPGEYTQLTGRAGRRGIDIEGHAVVMWRPGMIPEQVAALASTRTYPLNSSFRPTYNMSANLIASYGAERTRKILESSFAQFQADKSVVGVASRVRKNEKAMEGYRESFACHLGDFGEYFSLRRRVNQLEKKAAQSNQSHARTQAHQSLQELAPGDIIFIPHGRSSGYAVVLTRAESNVDPRVSIITEDGHLRTASTRDFEGQIDPVSHIKIPRKATFKTPKDRRDTASRMRQALIDGKSPRHMGHRAAPSKNNSLLMQLEQAQAELRAHPCHGCSEREAHARWAERWYSLNQETDALRRQIARRTNTIAQVFNRIAQLLQSYGYVKEEEGQLRLTASGQSLRRIYGEKDLLTSLALGDGLLEGLTAPAVAAVVAALVYQGRRDGVEHLAHYPEPAVRERLGALSRLLADLNAAESEHRLDQTPPMDLGLVNPIYTWAAGAHLAKTLEDSDLAAGDFVRWAKQVVDTLDQITHIGQVDPGVRAVCQEAIEAVRRGVVALDI